MKHLCLTIIALLLTASILAQAPHSFNYQGVARDLTGDPIPNNNIGLRIAILQGSATGSEVFKETLTTNTNNFGLFTLKIGTGSTVNGSIADVEWGNDEFYLQIEMYNQDDNSYQVIGANELLSVPYALYAKEVENADDDDADPQNEIQTLSLNQNNLSISNGNSVNLSDLSDDDPDPTNELQTLSLNNHQLTISNGNTVTLTDNVNDADADPNNELQTLSVSGNGLSLSNGNTVTLPSSSLWTPSGNNIYYPNRVGIRTSDITHSLTTRGLSANYDDFGNIGTLHGVNSNGYSYYQLYENGNRLLYLGSAGTAPNSKGYIRTSDSDDNPLVEISSTTNNDGTVQTNTSSGQRLVRLTSVTNGGGYMATYGTNGYENSSFSSVSGNINHGFISVYGSDGWPNNKAGVYVNTSNQGVVFGDIKNFRMDHPNRNGKEIWYASIEGPEAAAFLRGTFTLKDGIAEVDFPEHFQIVISEGSMTVMISPLSAESKGIAVIEKSITGFKVKELFDGKGNYEFDWEVKAVRSGFEDYRVIRDKSEAMSMQPIKENTDK